MIKRSIIVLVATLCIIFIPYCIGLHFIENENRMLRWVVGGLLITLTVSMIIAILDVVIKLYEYIKYGE